LILQPYFSPRVRLVDEHYKTLVLPGESFDPTEQFFVTAEWNLEQMKGFIRSWSRVQKYIEERGRDPIATVAEELEAVWGEADTIHRVRWPLFVRVARVA